MSSSTVRAQDAGDFYEKADDHGSGGKGATVHLKQGTSDRGGDVELESGGGTGPSGPVAGDIWLKAGTSYGKGGDIFLRPGAAYSSSNGGKVFVGNNTGTFFHRDGKFTARYIEVNGKVKAEDAEFHGHPTFHSNGLKDFNIKYTKNRYQSARLQIGIAEDTHHYFTNNKEGDIVLRKRGIGRRLIITHATQFNALPSDATGIGAANHEDALWVHNNGNVRIGKYSEDAPEYKLDVNGTIRAHNDLKLHEGEIRIGPNDVPDLRIGRYTRGEGELGEHDNPTMIASPREVERELILFGNTTGTLHLRMYDGSLKFGTKDDNLKAIIRNDGTATFKELKIENHPTADFVFEDNYSLRDLDQVEAFIKENRHLPDIPSAKEMESSGVNVAEMNKLLLMKIEELTLYAIEKERKVEELEEKGKEQKAAVKELREANKNTTARLEKLEEILLEMN